MPIWLPHAGAWLGLTLRPGEEIDGVALRDVVDEAVVRLKSSSELGWARGKLDSK